MGSAATGSTAYLAKGYYPRSVSLNITHSPKLVWISTFSLTPQVLYALTTVDNRFSTAILDQGHRIDMELISSKMQPQALV